MSIKDVIKSAVCVAAFAFAGGCVANDSSYVPTGEPIGAGPRLTDYDLKINATAMVDSMLGNQQFDKKLREQFPDRRPTITLGDFSAHNKTCQHSGKGDHNGLRTDIMVKTIRSRLVNSGKFVIVEPGSDTDYIMQGWIDEGEPVVEGRTLIRSYTLTMELVNTRVQGRSELDWSGQKEITKESKRPSIGW